MNGKEPLIFTSEAMFKVEQVLGHGITRATMINWAKKHNLGYQLGGRGKWYFYENRLNKFLKVGENDTEKTKTTNADTRRHSKTDGTTKDTGNGQS